MPSITEIAERIARHHLDSERVSVTQFCDIQAAIEQAIRNERERCARFAQTYIAHAGYTELANDCAAVIRSEVEP